MEQREARVDVIDMLFYLLKRWKSFIAFVVIGALAFAGAYAVKTEYGSSDTEIEISESAEAYMEAADALLSQAAAIKTYSDNSIYLNLPEDNTYAAVLNLYVYADSKTYYAAEVFSSLVKDPDFIQNMKDIAGLECEDQYVEELISVSYGLKDLKPASIADDTDTTEPDAISEAAAQIITYTIRYDDEDVLKSVLNELTYAISETDLTLMDLDNYTMNVISSSVKKIVDTSALEAKKNTLTSMYTCIYDAEKILDYLDTDELEYFEENYLVDSNWNELENEETAPIGGEALSKKSLVKYGVLGAIVGLFVWWIIFVIRYISDKRIRFAAEVTENYGVKIIGRILTGNRRLKGISAVRERSLNGEVAGFMNVSELLRMISFMDEDKIYLSGESANADVASVKKSLGGRESSGAGIIADNFGSIDKDGRALATAKEAGAVILIVKVGETTGNEIIKSIQTAAFYGIKVAGAVVVE